MRCVIKALLLSLLTLQYLPALAINLYDASVYRALIADRKAAMPGDLLTVLVLENANAQTEANLASSKQIKTALEAGYNRDRHEVDFGLKGDGKMAAKTARNGKIRASLTVRIQEVLPNGSYYVEGQQHIRINGEVQAIVVGGVVRPEDITPQNTVLSTRLAEARITYNGQGAVSNSQRFNPIYKTLSFLGLV